MDVNRFWARVEKLDDGCWRWTGAINSDGYGIIEIDRKRTLVHRLSWTLHRGPIPPRLKVCHHCPLHACLNPDHLYLDTIPHRSRQTHWAIVRRTVPHR
jgi:hypothetical protein